MAPLDTGRFIITNSKFKNVAFLADPNPCSVICGDYQQDRPGEMWNVVRLSNGNYTIKSYAHATYATCEFIAKPDVGNNIIGLGGDSYQQQWKFTEARPDLYVICPTKSGHVYWHLANTESRTPITLESYCESSNIQWNFIKVEDSEESDADGGLGDPTGRELEKK